MATGDIFTLKAQWIDNETLLRAENSFHFEQGADLVFDFPGPDLVQSFRDYAEDAYTLPVTNRYAIEKYQVIERPSGLVIHEEVINGIGGQSTGDTMPPNVAGILSYRTVHAGRTGRGRIYMPPANEVNNAAAGKPGNTYNGVVTDFGDTLMDMASGTAITSTIWYWGLWSVKDQAFYRTTSYVPRNFWGSQRGRRF